MTVGMLIQLMRNGIQEILTMIVPVLAAALVIGLVVAVFQAVTSIQEQTLTFLPKLIVILAVLFFLGGWMFTHLGEYTIHLFQMIPELAR